MLGVLAVLAVVYVLVVPATNLIASQDIGHLSAAQRALHLQSAREAVRTQLLTLGAGLFAAGALIFTGQNFRLSRRTLEVAEQGQMTERFTKAIEQLGSEKLDIRLGGIYALERVARDSARDHPVVMDVLAAFLRERTRQVQPGGRAGLRPDFAAAMKVIGRRDPNRDVDLIDLWQARLVRADLHGLNFESVSFRDADLTGALLFDTRLAGAYLGDANLSDSNMRRADLARAVLTNANLSAALLEEADLSHANLRGAVLTSTDFTRANLTGAGLLTETADQANLSGADLTGAHLPLAMTLPDGWKREPDSNEVKQA